MIKSNYDQVCLKATILEKAKEPRSYWVRKDEGHKIVRRNTSQIKPSKTRSAEKTLEPELYPEDIDEPPDDRVTAEDNHNNTPDNRIAVENNNTNNPVDILVHETPNNRAPNVSRFGRVRKHPRRLNL